MGVPCVRRPMFRAEEVEREGWGEGGLGGEKEGGKRGGRGEGRRDEEEEG
jgi:hypothetical protein